MVIAQYDENSNGRMSFAEFNQCALPATDESLRALATSRDFSPHKTNCPVLPPSLEMDLANLFRAELSYHRRTEAIKADLNTRFDFNVHAGYDALDKMHPHGRVDRCEIRNFVDAYLRWLIDSECDAIIRR